MSACEDCRSTTSGMCWRHGSMSINAAPLVPMTDDRPAAAPRTAAGDPEHGPHGDEGYCYCGTYHCPIWWTP